MSDADTLAEIKARHDHDERWRGSPSMICPQSHDDRAWLLAEVDRLRAENDKLRDRLFAMGAMNEPPCFACGYNGPGYFQPKQHACAARHHRAVES